MEIGCVFGIILMLKSISCLGGISSKSWGKTIGNSFTTGTDSREGVQTQHPSP